MHGEPAHGSSAPSFMQIKAMAQTEETVRPVQSDRRLLKGRSRRLRLSTRRYSKRKAWKLRRLRKAAQLELERSQNNNVTKNIVNIENVEIIQESELDKYEVLMEDMIIQIAEEIEIDDSVTGTEENIEDTKSVDSVENVESTELKEETKDEKKLMTFSRLPVTPSDEVLSYLVAQNSVQFGTIRYDTELPTYFAQPEASIKENSDTEDADSDPGFVIERATTPLPVEPISKTLDITDFSYVFKQIINLDKHSKIDCGVEHFEISRCRVSGLEKTYWVRCRMCGCEEQIQCLREQKEVLDLNLSAVAANLVTGGGCAQLEQILNGMNIANMSRPKYFLCENKIIEAFETAALQEMVNAAREERELAIKRGDVVGDAKIPCIPVVTDGSWMKRSYHSGNMNSLSGVGAILGFYTRKVLYIGCKNKWCSMCDRLEKKKEPPRGHRCFKNWDRNQSSAGMESAAILEGFACSLQMHGLIYSVLIADGDSSVYKKILDMDPYKEYKVRVKKVECKNHLLRNFCKKLREITAKGRCKKIRDVVRSRIYGLRCAINKASTFRSQEDVDVAEQIKRLREDLSNMPSHVFGEHEQCAKLNYFCTKTEDSDSTNYIPQMKETGIYEAIQKAMQPLFTHAESLLYGLNNNCAEGFNSIIAKHIAGKRINFAQRGSYQGRVCAAVVQFNTKEALSRLHAILKKEPPDLLKILENKRKRGAEISKSNRDKKRTVKNCIITSYDPDYGPHAVQPDAEEFEYSPDKEGQSKALEIVKNIAECTREKL